jgi:methionyl-tRNA formyltransferase
MRIEFVTQDDSLYILPFFDEFLRHYGEDFDIVQISASRSMGKRSRIQLVKELGALYGPLGLARLATRSATARVIGKLARPKGATRYYTLSQLCHAYSIPYARIGNPNAPSFLESTRQRSPDVLVSVACPYILKEALLKVAPGGAINIHHAPLPRYKGMMPTFWQMFYGEKSVGVTVHYMSPKLDEGPTLLRSEQSIQEGESLDHLIQRSKRYGAHCVAHVLKQLQNGPVSPVQTNDAAASYFTFPTLSEIREFRRRGLRAI